MSDEPQTFSVRIDGGEERQITVATGIYRDAAMAVPALLGLDLPVIVEIWVPHLVRNYPPLAYRISEDEFGGVKVQQVILK